MQYSDDISDFIKEFADVLDDEAEEYVEPNYTTVEEDEDDEVNNPLTV